MPQFFGKYAGKVDQNIDPFGKGRLLVTVPAVFGDGTVWAMPCVPYAGPNVGFFAMPPTGADIWIEFEAGDPNCPIWSGCFWKDDNTAPVSFSPLADKTKVLKTDTCTLTLDDTTGVGGITIEYGSLKIEIKQQGIEISNGMGATIKLTGPSVAINDPALKVT
ncbi:phage baseplate assembly protein V [Methylomonas sp. MgM2]